MPSIDRVPGGLVGTPGILSFPGGKDKTPTLSRVRRTWKPAHIRKGNGMETQVAQTKVVSEAERTAVESAIIDRLGPDAPKPIFGASGNSPYSSQTVVFLAIGANEHGARVALADVCRSHNGAGAYKGRGRWRKVCVCAQKADGNLAVCAASDRDATEVGSSGFYVRPWETHAAEQASRGMGLAQDAMACAFAAVGL